MFEAVMPDAPKYWFPAKRYGWGWSAPVTWQGWVVVVAWVAAFVAGTLLLEPGSVAHVVFVLVMGAVIIGVCYAKGEPPRWRWGGRG